MAKMNVKKGDNVMVIAGKDKGNAGKVLKVLPEENRVYVEGINIVSKQSMHQTSCTFAPLAVKSSESVTAKKKTRRAK